MFCDFSLFYTLSQTMHFYIIFNGSVVFFSMQTPTLETQFLQ